MSESETSDQSEEIPAGETEEEEATSPDGKELSAEEQMAAYEEALKETDWGHQPC